ncbi:MAG: hypothetical protein QOJ92_663 [Frankiales bacterium]|nr:hypothetical protein [Frankiales bacterium]
MNLFVACLRTPLATGPCPPIHDALREVGAHLPRSAMTQVEHWVSQGGEAHLCLMHSPPERVGGREYVEFSPSGGFATFSGRPINVVGQATAGDPLRPSELAESDPRSLDGRFVCCAFEPGRGLWYFADALGGNQLYEAKVAGWLVVSNVASALVAVTGGRGLDPLAAASFFHLGWSMDGQPLAASVRRVPGGVLKIRRADGHAKDAPFWNVAELIPAFGRGLDAPAAAERLIETMGRLADWPGRPSVIPLSGGRDSRVILAACMRAGVTARVYTSAIPTVVGFPETPDVRVARALAEVLGVEHEVRMPGTKKTPSMSTSSEEVLRSAARVDALAPGTVSLWDVGPVADAVGGQSLGLTHTGQGGELSRRQHSTDATDVRTVADGIARHYAPALPRGLATAAAANSVLAELRSWCASMVEEGFSPGDLPDVFYLTSRMANWAGVVQTVHEPVGDVTSGLWTRGMVADQFALPPHERSRERFVALVLAELNPRTLQVPFEGGAGPATKPSSATRSATGRSLSLARRATKKAYRELVARRIEAMSRRRVNGDVGASRVQAMFAAGLARASDAGDDAVWAFLDRRRTLRLLSRNPDALNIRSQRHGIRAATYFLTRPEGPVHPQLVDQCHECAR